MTTPLDRSGHDREGALLNAALELPSGERAAFLDHACSNDAALRQRLERLIDAHQEAGAFLEKPSLPGIISGLRRTETLTVSEKPGDRIGRYKLLQEIGEGGCGVVYMAEQEEPVRRRVALKVIKLGMDTKQVVARFEAERQALALMDHPNIAKVFDAGATETGRPYFVMELVRGVRITEYCDQNRLSTDKRLQLFVQVCHAVQHAHQKGVIHRDIKPSSILVMVADDVPVPKMIDFGIAKAIGERLTDKTVYTRFEQFIGTPAYMSPEQAGLSGLDVDTRSDIYALGVLLYELLTGRTPFERKELAQAALDEIMRRIREEEPPKPSTRLSQLERQEQTTTAQRQSTEAPKLLGSLRGDLDWIVMKCLEKDRTRRYETANGLAQDIERHLHHEPVVARSPTKTYRVQKFIRRNKMMVTAAAAVSAALVLGLVVSVWQAAQASRQRARAEANEKKATSAMSFAQSNELLARQNAYAADVTIANTAWRENNLGQAMTALRRQIPKPGETDLRGIEWRYLWHRCQGQQLKTFHHEAEVTGAELSPDGRWLATESGGAFWLWDTAREGERRRLTSGAPRDVGLGVGEHLAFDPKGRFLATATTSEVLIWSLTDWRKLKSLPSTDANPSFSGDGTRLATFGWEGGVQIWNVATWEPLVKPGDIKVGMANCRRAALNRDGSLLAVLWQNTWRSESLAVGEVTLWKVPEGQLLFKWDEIKDGTEVAFSEDDHRLAVSTMGPPSEVWVWSLPEGKPVAHWLGSQRLGRALAFAPGGQGLATAGSDQVIRLWDTSNTNRPPTLFRGHLDEIFSLRFASDGPLVSASGDKTACLWDIRQGRSSSSSFPIPLGRLICGHTADAHRMVTVNLNELTFEEWDMESGRRLRQKSIQGADSILHPGTLYSGRPLQNGLLVNNYIYDGDVPPGVGRLRYLGHSPQGPGSPTWDLSATMGDGRVFAWNAESGELVYSNQFAKNLLIACPVADHRRLVLLEDQGGALSMYDMQTDKIERIEEHVPVMPPSWKVSPDGRLFACFLTNDQVKVWDATAKRVRFTVKLPDLPIHTVTTEFSTDSKLLAVATWGGRTQVWDVGSGRPVGDPLPRYSADSWKVSFSADSRSLVTYSMDNTARVWSIATGREMISGLPLNGFLNYHLEWKPLPPDGNSVLEGDGEQAIGVVRLPTIAEIDAVENGRIKRP